MKTRVVPGLTLALLLAGCAGGGSTLSTPETTTGSIRAAKASVADTQALASQPQRQAETVQVGLMLPLTGPGHAALIAETMKKAAELALADARAPHVKLVIRDDKGTPDGAAAAAKDLAAAKVEVVLGPLFARSVQTAGQALRHSNIPVVAFSNDRQVAGQNVSLMSFLAEPEVDRIVAFAAARGKKRQAALIPADSYGRLVEAAYRAAAARHGVQIVALESYPTDQANAVAGAVLKLRDAVRGIEEHGEPVTGLFLPGGEETLALVSPQLKQAGIDTKRLQVLGTGALDYANAGRDPHLVGAWFAAPDPKGWQDFSARFTQAHGHAPPRIASLAHDAMVLAIALSNGPDGARYLPAALTRSSGFDGVDGAFRLTADGTVDRSLAVLEVQQVGARVIEAPVRTAAEARAPGGSGAAAASADTGRPGVLSSIPSAFPPTN